MSDIDVVDDGTLNALVSGIEDAWNAHDMSRFAARFAPDAEFVNVAGWWWRGREEIERNHAVLHQTIFRDSTMRLELASVNQVKPGLCVAHVRWRMVGHGAGGAKQTTEPRAGIWSWVVRGRQGTIEIVSAHNTDTLGMPATHPLAR